ncbi:peptide chain release factor N(5)-glutamine methyltransferase [uncultured Psychrosphaera sp.]|uniref:peptide chain release factor N(5)-glutamine methyltransferase n=1 Tax=uncultured Psychrosphaera sp. TaxID=1403522 RepID=UPI002628A20C|nr:peptide chain release factor N(5)-glutamine methyltransferase [uncultured Psychrosphaera sp.]
MDNKNQIKWLLNAATSTFNQISDTAKLDAEILMCHVLDCNRTYLFTWPDKVLDETQIALFHQLCAKRQAGHPIAHIVGYRAFWTLNLKVTPTTLIPRPDTETLVEHALLLVAEQKDNQQYEHLTGLDLGTGTGAIALSLASELPHWDWLAADFIADAVTLAQENAELNGITNCKIIQSDWFEQIPNTKFNLIVSNPPYIEENDPHLKQGDVRFEPLSALTAADNGLSDIKKIVSQAKDYLHDNGLLIIEHGNTQGEAIRDVFIQNGYRNTSTIKDLSENDRITVGYFKLMG